MNLAQVFTSDWATELLVHAPILVIRSLLVFVTVLFVVRWTGKRSIANLAPFDLAMVILIGEVAAIPVAELNVDLLHGILPVFIMGGLHVLVTTLALYSQWFEAFTEGRPTLLVKDGRVLKKNLIKERVSMTDLMTALRHKEILDLRKVKEAWIEQAGGVSVIRKKEEDAATPKDLERAIERIVQENIARMRVELEELIRRQGGLAPTGGQPKGEG